MKKIEYKHRLPMFTVEEYEGETIEMKVRRLVDEKQPISDGATLAYTEKKDGVLPEYDIRTDKWEIAENAMNNVNTSKIEESKKVGTGINAPKQETGEE